MPNVKRAKPLTVEEKDLIIKTVLNAFPSGGLTAASVYDILRKKGKLIGKTEGQVRAFLNDSANGTHTSLAEGDPLESLGWLLHFWDRRKNVIAVKRGRRTFYQRRPEQISKPPPEPTTGLPLRREVEIKTKPKAKKKVVPWKKRLPNEIPVNPRWLHIAKRCLGRGDTYRDFTYVVREDSFRARRLAVTDPEKFEQITLRCWNAALFRITYKTVQLHCVCVCEHCQLEKARHCKDEYTGCP